MIVITGGAGFIGSNLVAELARRGKEVAVVDWLGTDERWRNLAKHELAAVIEPGKALDWMSSRGERIEAIFHMGAISATTETNVDLIAERNIRATLSLLEWCTASGTRLILASSAATYGDGSAGFADEFDVPALAKLRPLNAYGWSKHVIDRRLARLVAERRPLPPQWVALKFFNVYGPNEYHKGSMQSVISQNFRRVRDGEPLRLFRSYKKEYGDGGQLRDFVYVRDCVDAMLWLLEKPQVSGLFNLGTGQARSWLDLGNALFAALGRPPKIEFIDMPPELREKYQYYTQATMQKLRDAGYSKPFTSLEAGVADYVRSYLSAPDPYR